MRPNLKIIDRLGESSFLLFKARFVFWQFVASGVNYQYKHKASGTHSR